MTEFKVGDRVEIRSSTVPYGQSGTGVIRNQDEGPLIDIDGDHYITLDTPTEYWTNVWANPEDLTLIQEDKSEPQLDGVWVAWYNGKDGRVITVHQEEIHALRYALNNGGTAKRLGYGEELIP